MINLKPILFSAIQPSGRLTLGNYIGTMRHWSKMQNDYYCLYCIADLHALTTLKKSDNLKKTIFDTLALYLTCGINPDKSIIFVQSHVYEHCQLNWVLNNFSQFGELLRMTQFKSKRTKKNNNTKNVNIGLFNYPILMSSDILLYQTNKVPIGQDQKQHLEFTRNIADRFNMLYGNTFTIPEPLISKYGSKIMSLLDLEKKMSKSDKNENNVIFLLENIKSVALKIQNSITDSDNPPRIYYDIKKKPGISNLLEILSAVTNKNISILEIELQGIMYSEFKNIVSEHLCIFLSNLQKSYFYYRKNESFLEEIAYKGAIKAQLKSQETLQKTYSKLGFFLK